MRIPYCRYAYVTRSKIENYLISLTHPVGKHKAVFFRSIGFNEGNIDLLTKCLLDIVHTNDILNKVVNQFGINYKVDGSFQAPNGSIIRLTTAWTVDAGKRAPRLVSAYPV